MELFIHIPGWESFYQKVLGKENINSDLKVITEWPILGNLGYEGINSIRNMGSIPFIIILALLQFATMGCL
jgi:hypothetical protein